MKILSYLLNLMLLESQVKFDCPKKFSGASQQNYVAAYSLTIEAAGYLF